MPVILVSRMQDAAEIRLNGRTNECSPVHDLGNVLHAFGQLDVVDNRVDCRKGAENILNVETFFEGKITLWVKRVGGGHPASKPKKEAGGCTRDRRFDLRLIGEQAGAVHPHGDQGSCAQFF